MAYLDLNEEIYRIIRQLASGGTISDALLAKVCARFGLPQDSLHDLHRLLACLRRFKWRSEQLTCATQ